MTWTTLFLTLSQFPLHITSLLFSLCISDHFNSVQCWSTAFSQINPLTNQFYLNVFIGLLVWWSRALSYVHVDHS